MSALNFSVSLQVLFASILLSAIFSWKIASDISWVYCAIYKLFMSGQCVVRTASWGNISRNTRSFSLAGQGEGIRNSLAYNIRPAYPLTASRGYAVLCCASWKIKCQHARAGHCDTHTIAQSHTHTLARTHSHTLAHVIQVDCVYATWNNRLILPCAARAHLMRALTAHPIRSPAPPPPHTSLHRNRPRLPW